MAIKAGVGGDMNDGLCRRMVIEAKRVLDGCARTDENTTLTLTSAEQLPQGAEFVSARIVSSELAGYAVNCASDGEYCKVDGEIVTEFAVTYSLGDALATIKATLRENRDVLLRLPRDNALVPFVIEVRSVMNVRSGAIIGSNSIAVTGCRLQIVKVTANVDILVPSYGYCEYPPCTGCACHGINGNIFPDISV